MRKQRITTKFIFLLFICLLNLFQILYATNIIISGDSESISSHYVARDEVDILVKKGMDDSLTNKIEAVAKKWFDYYQINVDSFVFHAKTKINFQVSIKDSAFLYYKEFEKSDDNYEPILHDYSPNKQKYVNLMASMLVTREEDGKYHFSGSDDCQILYLYDRKKKSATMFSFRGVSNFADAVFWVDNDIFFVVGYDSHNSSLGNFLIEVYNSKEGICESYILKQKQKTADYFGMYNMRSRGIIID